MPSWMRIVYTECLPVLVLWPTLHQLSRLHIQHRNLLVARMKVTSYNYHRSAPFLRALVDQPLPSLPAARASKSEIFLAIQERIYSVAGGRRRHPIKVEIPVNNVASKRRTSTERKRHSMTCFPAPPRTASESVSGTVGNLLMALLVLLNLSVAALAQQYRSYGYGFTGPLVVPKSAFTRWDGTFIHLGGGGEAALARRFGLGAEIGALKPLTNRYAISTGLASVSPTYHFLGTGSQRKFDPFTTGGFSVLFAGGAGAAIHYGGGMNYWLRSRLGLRVEFRDHLWSPESGESVHLIDFRFGVVFRVG